MPSSRVVRVHPDVAGLGRSFDYLVPAPCSAVPAGSLRIGSEVRVVLNGRSVAGWVVGEEAEGPGGVEMRSVGSWRGWGPPPEVVEICRWAAWRWAGPLSAFLRTASAPRLVKRLPEPPVLGPLSTGKQRRRDPLAEAALSGGTAVLRLAPAADPMPVVVEAARRALGSAKDGGALIVVPERLGVGEVSSRLSRLGFPVAQLPEQWDLARAGSCVAVGTRAGALAPLPRLKAAVVLDAHDEALVETRAPTWSAWRIVAERARRDAAPCVLVSSCPTLEMLEAGRLVTPSRAEERRGWPPIEILDRRRDDPRTAMFSPRLVAALKAASASGKRAFCVLNRTGRAKLVACAACGELARCEACRGALETIGSGAATRGVAEVHETLSCRRCSRQRPRVCARCGSTRFKILRRGVTSVREELEALLGVPVLEVTSQRSTLGVPRVFSHGSGSAGAGIAARYGASSGEPKDSGDEGDVAVVVGTEAVLHRRGGAQLVCFLDFDSELLAPRLFGAEQALALVARAARVVSGSAPSPSEASASNSPLRAPGRVMVQTRLPEHEVLRAAVHADPGYLSNSESSIRRSLGLPPFRAMARLSHESAGKYAQALTKAAPEMVEVNPAGDGSWDVLARDHRTLCDLLASVARPPGRLRVEVDPIRA